MGTLLERIASPALPAATRLVACLLVTALWAPSASAQDGFDVQNMAPGVSRSTAYWNAPFAQTLQQGGYDLALFLNYADSPLVLLNPDGERTEELVSGMLTAEIMGAFGLTNWLDLGISIPLILAQSGEELTLLRGADASDAGFGIGDVRVHARAAFLSDVVEGQSGPMLGLDVGLRLPTGDEEVYQGGEFRAEPRLLFDWVFANRSRVGLQAGYLLRPSRALENVTVNDQLTLSGAGAVALGAQGRGWIIPELRAQFGVLEGGVDDNDASLEALIGGRWEATNRILLELGTGMGFLDGVGSPDFRIFAGVSFHSPREGDRDGDGYLDSEDGCPDEPEDFDGFEDGNGCPDPDNDGDGVLDTEDGSPRGDGFGSCADDPEDFDGFEDEDGCPDPDNDGDGVLDVNDGPSDGGLYGSCLNDPEDRDGYEDADGCPDPDNDGDGYPDVTDGEVGDDGFGSCMNEPEDFDGDRDEDGCYDQEVITVTCVAIEIDSRVYFDTDSDVIQRRSYSLLDGVAEVLRENTYVRLLSIEGHTDDRASDAHNQDLSERRAASVVRYLVDAGVSRDRLRSVGHGEGQPIDTNGTEAGRQNNRRVEFLIIEQDTEDCR